MANATMIIEMKQERATLNTSLQALIDKYMASGDVMSAEDKASMEKMEAEFDTLDAKIEAGEKQLARDRRVGEMEPKDLKKVDPKNRELVKAFPTTLFSEASKPCKCMQLCSRTTPRRPVTWSRPRSSGAS